LEHEHAHGVVKCTYGALGLAVLLGNCNARLIKRQNSCVSVLFPGSVDSTTVQNIVIIAIASRLQRKSSYIGLQPYEYTA
jgi:hypothetical protein